MSQDHAALVIQFQDVTGADEERAKFYLEAANWRLEVALGSFFESDGGADAGVDAGDVAMIEDENNDSEDEVIPEPTGAATRREKPNRFKPLEISDSSEEDSDEEGQAFYVGGSERSGQQVLGPPRKAKNKNADELVKDVFKSAKEHGAVVVDPTMASSSKGPKVFSGTGHRLGQTTDDTEVIPGKKAPPKPQEVVLRLWKTGFTVDDGPLRDYNEPGNLQFIASIKRGEVPMELIRAARGQEVHINLEDHRHDEFVAPKTNFRAFGGAGHTLGSPAPNFVGAPSATSKAASASGASSAPATATGSEAAARAQVPMDESKPTTQIQVRLTDGSRLVAKMNTSHTVGDLRKFISGARPDLTSQPFMILSSFPTKELTQESQTLEEAGLMNATVLMRHK